MCLCHQCPPVSQSHSPPVLLSPCLPVPVSGSLSVWVSEDCLEPCPVWWECWRLPAVSYYRKHFHFPNAAWHILRVPRVRTPAATITALHSTPSVSSPLAHRGRLLTQEWLNKVCLKPLLSETVCGRVSENRKLETKSGQKSECVPLKISLIKLQWRRCL